MKKVNQINNLVIKEKSANEVPSFIDPDRKYAVFAIDGKWLEDNLTYDEAKEFCKSTLDYVK